MLNHCNTAVKAELLTDNNGTTKKNGGGYIVLSQLFIYTFSLCRKEIFPKATRRWVSISHFLINLPITHIYFQVVDALNKLKYILSFLDSYG